MDDEQLTGSPSPAFWGNLAGVQFEVEVYRNEKGQWVATAVEYAVSVTGLTEKEALAKIMDALAAHFKKQGAR